MMSRIAPRVQRTSFVSAAGGYWKCMPRNVPFLKLKEILAWAMTGFRPCASNSFWQNARAKKPRESSLRSRSIRQAPLSFVSVKIIACKSCFRGWQSLFYLDRTVVLPGVPRQEQVEDAGDGLPAAAEPDSPLYSFQKNFSSICCVRIRYSSCFRRVKVRY